MMMVTLPSGIFSTLNMRATVPNRYTSFPSGISVFSSVCATTPIVLVVSLASLIRRIEASRPAEIGTTTPGKSTVLRSGRIGNTWGTRSRSISSSSSVVSRGINSAFSSICSVAKLSKFPIFISILLICDILSVRSLSN